MPNENGAGPYGSVSYARHNPGNLRVSQYEAYNEGGYSGFHNDFEGFMALVRQLELYAQGRTPPILADWSIGMALATYTGLAPSSVELDSYLKTVEQVAGVSREDYISSLI